MPRETAIIDLRWANMADHVWSLTTPIRVVAERRRLSCLGQCDELAAQLTARVAFGVDFSCEAWLGPGMHALDVRAICWGDHSQHHGGHLSTG